MEKGEELQETALQILQKELAPEAKSERERVIEVLQEAGLIRPLSEELRRMIDPNIDYEAVRRELAERSFDPPLSQIIIENRGEK
jgi:antirestriction protein